MAGAALARSFTINRRLPVVEVVDDDMAAVLRDLPAHQKLQMIDRMWESARMLVRSALRAEHPEWSEAELNRAVASRMSHGAV